jgi:hypothetical protein
VTDPRRLEKFDESYFLVDGDVAEEIPRVSTVINPGGIPPSQAIDLERGTRVHQWTEALDRGQVTVEHIEALRDTEMEKYLQAWIAFKARHEFEPVNIEAMVWGELGGKRLFGDGWGLFGGKRYAGTVDRIGFFTDGSGQRHILLLDIKTTIQAKPGMSKRHGMQLAAYAEAWRQRSGVTVDKRWIVFLRPDGTFDVKDYVLDKYLTEFQAALREHCKRVEEEADVVPEPGKSGNPVGEDTASEHTEG